MYLQRRQTFVLSTIFLFISFLANSQHKFIDGRITNGKDVEGIHILNNSSRFNSVTNAYGEFSITVQQGDTLIVSSITYAPKQVIVEKASYDSGFISITLQELVNELEEVYLGPSLTGNLERDLQRIKVTDQINFDDVGIPGFKGNPEEKIAPIVPGLGVDVESLYKHLSGYYRKLRLQRKWDAENAVVLQIIYLYSPSFFEEVYGIPEEKLTDFLLFCVETTQIKKDFNDQNFGLVLEVFALKGKEYTLRLQEKRE